MELVAGEHEAAIDAAGSTRSVVSIAITVLLRQLVPERRCVSTAR